MKMRLLAFIIAVITLAPRSVWALFPPEPEPGAYEMLFSLNVRSHSPGDKVVLEFAVREHLPVVINSYQREIKGCHCEAFVVWNLKENQAAGMGDSKFAEFVEKRYHNGWTLEESSRGSCRVTSGTARKEKLVLATPSSKDDFLVQGETLQISSFEQVDERTFRIKGIFSRSLLVLEQNYILPPCQIIPFESEVKLDEKTTLWHLKVEI